MTAQQPQTRDLDLWLVDKDKDGLGSVPLLMGVCT